jgi:hypothetical protein
MSADHQWRQKTQQRTIYTFKSHPQLINTHAIKTYIDLWLSPPPSFFPPQPYFLRVLRSYDCAEQTARMGQPRPSETGFYS